VTHIDWRRRRCYVEPADLPARSLWQGALPPESFELSQAQRSVLLGVTPDVEVSPRASKVPTAHREESSHRVWELGTVVAPRGDELWWWTGPAVAETQAWLPRWTTSSTSVASHRTIDCCHAWRSIRPNFDPRWTT
jgi:ATP-dependent helicase Lhr and Lhr-like helicase